MLPGPKPRSPLRADPHRPQPAAPRPGGGEAVPIGRTGGPGGAAVRPHGGDGRADGAVPAGCAAPPARGGPAGERGVGPAGGAGGESRDCGAAGRGAARGAGWGGLNERSFPRSFSAALSRFGAARTCLPARTGLGWSHTAVVHPFAVTQRGTFLPSRPSPSAGGALGARAFLLVWAENPSKPMLCVLSPPSLLGDGDRAEHLRCPH